MTVVLDSWAVLRYLENTSPASQAVADLLAVERPLMSWINLGEVYYVLRRAVGEADAADAVRDIRTVIDVRLPDEQMVVDVARIKADHPMAYADAFGAALAVATDSTLWTGDPELPHRRRRLGMARSPPANLTRTSRSKDRLTSEHLFDTLGEMEGADVLERGAGWLDDVAEVDLDALSDPELDALVVGLQRLAHRLEAQRCRIVRLCSRATRRRSWRRRAASASPS
ncbi:MAG: type II toxin-antitoxin system VapC family toxin [Ilumatobacteraceae bacterium]